MEQTPLVSSCNICFFIFGFLLLHQLPPFAILHAIYSWLEGADRPESTNCMNHCHRHRIVAYSQYVGISYMNSGFSCNRMTQIIVSSNSYSFIVVPIQLQYIPQSRMTCKFKRSPHEIIIHKKVMQSTTTYRETNALERTAKKSPGRSPAPSATQDATTHRTAEPLSSSPPVGRRLLCLAMAWDGRPAESAMVSAAHLWPEATTMGLVCAEKACSPAQMGSLTRHC